MGSVFFTIHCSVALAPKFSSQLVHVQAKSETGGAKRKAVCWRYNEGNCTFGKGCKYPHICESYWGETS